MPLPIFNPVAQDLYDELEPHTHAEVSLDYPLAKFIEALTMGASEIADLARDSVDGPGWSKLLDINRSPAKALPWLGQFVGVKPPERLRVLERVNIITNPRADSNSTTGMTAAGTSTLSTPLGTGGYGMRVFRATSTVASNFSFQSNRFPVVVGRTYIGRTKAVTIPVGRQAQVIIDWYDAGAVFLSATSAAFSGALGERFITGVAPASAVTASVRLRTNGGAVGEILEGDGQLLADAATSPYFDGDTEDDAVAGIGYRWTGARFASTSEYYRQESDAEYSTRVKPLILARIGWERGTTATMKAIVQAFLTGGKQMAFRERTPTPYSMQIRTLTSETPDSALILRELLKVKPAGIKLDYATVAGQDFLGVETTHTDFAAVEADYPTFANMETDF